MILKIVQTGDPVLRRRIVINKQGSASTVVWNPWTTQALPDLAPEEFRRFVCVESGNVGPDRITLEPGASRILTVRIETGPLVTS